ncbi:hypothetical protein CRYUN_Cryun01aG0239400 [Craigia yunnanensis]
MASNAFRNGTGANKGATKPLASSNIKSRLPPSSNHSPGSALRRTNSSSFTTAAGVPGRVRVAVRLRPRNAEESIADADFADCVELQPELKRLKLRKNNWDSDTYEFDEVLTEFASQKRVYEVVAKPVVEVEELIDTSTAESTEGPTDTARALMRRLKLCKWASLAHAPHALSEVEDA